MVVRVTSVVMRSGLTGTVVLVGSVVSVVVMVSVVAGQPVIEMAPVVAVLIGGVAQVTVI